MTPTIGELEQRIREAVERAKREGWGIRADVWVAAGRECCPLGAAIRDGFIGTDMATGCRHAARRLGVSSDWCWAFAGGFDGMDQRHDWDPSAYALGRKFREELLQKETP